METVSFTSLGRAGANIQCVACEKQFTWMDRECVQLGWFLLHDC